MLDSLRDGILLRSLVEVWCVRGILDEGCFVIGQYPLRCLIERLVLGDREEDHLLRQRLFGSRVLIVACGGLLVTRALGIIVVIVVHRLRGANSLAQILWSAQAVWLAARLPRRRLVEYLDGDQL